MTGETPNGRPRSLRPARDSRAGRPFGESIEESADRGKLREARLQRVDLAPERFAAGELLRVPTEMLARDPHARTFAIKRVVVVEVPQDRRPRLRHRRRRQVHPGVEIVADFAKDPGPTLRGAADHDRIGAGMPQHELRLLGRRDVAVGDDGDAHRRLDGADRVVFHRTDEGAGTRAAVHREGADAGLLGDPRDRERVPVLGIASRADLERDGHVDGAHHGRHDRFDQRLVREQRGAGGDVADLLGRAAHVDVDDLRAAVDVVPRGVGHLTADRRRRSAPRSVPPRRDDRFGVAISPCSTGADSMRPSPDTA